MTKTVIKENKKKKNTCCYSSKQHIFFYFTSFHFHPPSISSLIFFPCIFHLSKQRISEWITYYKTVLLYAPKLSSTVQSVNITLHKIQTTTMWGAKRMNLNMACAFCGLESNITRNHRASSPYFGCTPDFTGPRTS